MGELNPVVVWLVILVLGLQLLEFLLRAARTLAARLGATRAQGPRARFLAMSPLEKIEAFKLDQLSDEALPIFLDAVDLPAAERRRIVALLGLARTPAPLPLPQAGLSLVAGDAPGPEVPPRPGGKALQTSSGEQQAIRS
jgi:hypothetical protein